MRIQPLQPRKDHTYIFVRFPGAKMNVPQCNEKTEEGMEEAFALCIQVNKKKKVDSMYFVREGEIRPFDFSDDESGTKAIYKVIRTKQAPEKEGRVSLSSFEYKITEQISIIQKESSDGFEFILVLNSKELFLVASFKERQPHAALVNNKLQSEKEELEPKEKVMSGAQSSALVLNKFKMLARRLLFEAKVSLSLIRILAEEAKRKAAVYSPNALEFIGPGDHDNHFGKSGVVP